MIELKAVLDALTALGESSREAFLWWLIADKVFPFVALLVVALLVFALVRRAMAVEGLDKFTIRLAREMRIANSDGPLDTYDRENMLRWIKDRRE